jgi:hypothetical protein
MGLSVRSYLKNLFRAVKNSDSAESFVDQPVVADTPTMASPAEVRIQAIGNYKRSVDRWLSICIWLGLLVAAVYGGFAGPGTGLHLLPGMVGKILAHLVTACLALSIAGAALAVGALVGFIFGLPRSLTSGEVREVGRQAAVATQSNSDASVEQIGSKGKDAITSNVPLVPFGANSNLERISDWLTTIIVGVGLTKLSEIPGAIELFGERSREYFGFGGKAFGISAGLFFLIAGFLMFYITTRTKIALIFTENDRDTQDVTKGLLTGGFTNADINPLHRDEAEPRKPSEGAGIAPSTAAPALRVEPSEEVRQLAQKSAFDATNPAELIVLANARAQTGDYATSLSFYREAMKSPSFKLSDKDVLNFAGVIGLNGDLATLDLLKSSLILAGNEAMLREIETKFDEGLVSAVRDNLYNGKFDESKDRGVLFLERNPTNSNEWINIWLACAYGQKHAYLTSTGGDPELIENAEKLALAQIEKAIQLKPDSRSFIKSLIWPAPGNPDNDLASLADMRVDLVSSLRAPPPVSALGSDQARSALWI